MEFCEHEHFFQFYESNDQPSYWGCRLLFGSEITRAYDGSHVKSARIHHGTLLWPEILKGKLVHTKDSGAIFHLFFLTEATSSALDAGGTVLSWLYLQKWDTVATSEVATTCFATAT